MKYLIAIIVILLGVIIYLLYFQDNVTYPDRSREVNELLYQISQLETDNSAIRHQNDSLKNVTQKVEREIIYREREIDETIAEDSTNAVVQYRRSLTENGWTAEGTENLTYREIGIGAKGLAKLPKLELQLKLADEQIENLEQLDANNEFIKKGYQDIIQIQDLTIKDRDEQLENMSSFSDDRVILYAGVGASYGADNKLQPTIQLGIGIRLITLWKNNSIVIR